MAAAFASPALAQSANDAASAALVKAAAYRMNVGIGNKCELLSEKTASCTVAGSQNMRVFLIAAAGLKDLPDELAKTVCADLKLPEGWLASTAYTKLYGKNGVLHCHTMRAK